MKKMFLTAVIIAASVCVASAQAQKTTTPAETRVVKETEQKTTEAKQADEWKNTLVTELKLSDEQVKKITDMNKAFDERKQAIETNTTLSDEVKAERKAMLKKAQETQFLRFLTPEQQAKYKELVEAKGK